jgi:hypothetical protein
MLNIVEALVLYLLYSHLKIMLKVLFHVRYSTLTLTGKVTLDLPFFKANSYEKHKV